MIKIVRSKKGWNEDMQFLLASRNTFTPVVVHFRENLGALEVLWDLDGKDIVSVENLRQDIEKLTSQKKHNLVFYGCLSNEIISLLIEISKESPVYSFIVSGADNELPENKVTIESYD